MEILLVVLTVLATGAAGVALSMHTKSKQLKEELEDPSRILLTEEEAIEKASHKARAKLAEAEKEALEIKTKADDYSRKTGKLQDEKESRLDKREKNST